MRFVPFLSMLFIAGSPLLAAAEPGASWSVTACPEPVVTEGIFAVGTEMSGLASLDGTGVLMVSNETRTSQLGILSRNPWNLRAGKEIPLVPPQGTDECDFEAVAANPEEACFYVLGSHSVAKKRAKPRLEQQALFRIPADPATHLPDPLKPGAAKSVSLLSWIQKIPEVGPSAGQPLQRNGLNLEGLAYKEGKLFIGCRGPNLAGKTPILETDAAALFNTPQSSWAMPKVHLLPLGTGQGVRDITPLKEGFLIVAGCAGSEGSSDFRVPEFYDGDLAFNLFVWKPGATPDVEKVGQIPILKGKAEGLLVVEETEEFIKVLVLYDGSYNGAPHLFKLTKPKSSAAAVR